MTLLLDTHALLWWLAGSDLDPEATERIADPSIFVAVSAASVWEAAIKAELGKLAAPESIGDAAVAEGFEPLPIRFEHAERAGALPPHHRDPIDHMLVAQAEIEGLAIGDSRPLLRRLRGHRRARVDTDWMYAALRAPAIRRYCSRSSARGTDAALRVRVLPPTRSVATAVPRSA